MKPVVVKGCTIAVKESGIAFTSAVIDTPESHEVNIDGNGAYFGELKVTVSGIMSYKGSLRDEVKPRNPRLITLIEIANALNINLSELLDLCHIESSQKRKTRTSSNNK